MGPARLILTGEEVGVRRKVRMRVWFLVGGSGGTLMGRRDSGGKEDNG